MRVTKPIDASVDQLESAKETAIALIGDVNSKNTIDLFFADDLSTIENGIKQLNEFSTKSWLLSAILLYSLIYDRDLYLQSGLVWAEYAKQSRERLGLDQRDITEQLSAARFFIKNHKALEKAGFKPNGANAKLARAELAVNLSGSVEETIKHLVNDTWHDYKQWYQSFKNQKKLPKPTEYVRSDIEFEGNHFKIAGVEAVKVSEKIPENERLRLNSYLRTIFEAIANGYEPAIIPVYDKNEAKRLVRLRDKARQQR